MHLYTHTREGEGGGRRIGREMEGGKRKYEEKKEEGRRKEALREEERQTIATYVYPDHWNAPITGFKVNYHNA